MTSWAGDLPSGNQKRFQRDAVKWIGVSLRGLPVLLTEIEALRLYPPFYPPMESFGHYLSAREIMRFSRIT
jgi:hypothetical protein